MRVKRRVFAGVVCEQEIYNVADGDGKRGLLEKKPRLRFRSPEERAQHRLEISRKRHARAFNENFDPSSLYSTLTFDMDNEVHSVSECRRLRDLFFRRLRYAYPDAVIFIYFGRGKTTHRFHLHMVSSGIPEEFIRKQWSYGEICRIEHLRRHVYYNKVDHGADYTGLANYLFDHWQPDFGGHRWKQTRNARSCEKEDAREIRRQYSEQRPPRAPKGYVLVETKATRYGYLWFKYVRAVDSC